MFVKIGTALIICVFLFGLVSCDLLSHDLEGNWSITTTPSSGTDFGSGTVSVSFSHTESNGVDLYEGSGTVGGTSYYAAIGHNPKSSFMNWDFVLAPSGASFDYIIGLGTYTTGNPVSGSYMGAGAWSGYSGDFTATKE